MILGLNLMSINCLVEIYNYKPLNSLFDLLSLVGYIWARAVLQSVLHGVVLLLMCLYEEATSLAD